MATQPRIETEAAAGGMEREEEQHDYKEYVGPRPFGGTRRADKSRAEVQHEHDCERADQTDAEPENQRHRKRELGKER